EQRRRQEPRAGHQAGSMTPRCTVCARASVKATRPAGWRCTGCHANLCAQHVAQKTVQVVTTVVVCVSCGELADVLTRHRAELTSYVKRLPSAFLWPLSRAGLFAIFGMGVGRAIFGYSPAGWV